MFVVLTCPICGTGLEQVDLPGTAPWQCWDCSRGWTESELARREEFNHITRSFPMDVAAEICAEATLEVETNDLIRESNQFEGGLEEMEAQQGMGMELEGQPGEVVEEPQADTSWYDPDWIGVERGEE